jgi:hypothetical protein
MIWIEGRIVCPFADGNSEVIPENDNDGPTWPDVFKPSRVIP